MSSDRSGVDKTGRSCAVTPAAHAVPTNRLMYPVTDHTASPMVVRTLRELGIEIMMT
jgi:hypothetical protein